MGFQFQSVASISTFLVADLGINYTEIGTLVGLYLLPGVVKRIANIHQRFIRGLLAQVSEPCQLSCPCHKTPARQNFTETPPPY